MLMKRSAGERIFDIGNMMFMIVLSIVSLYPLLYVLFASFSDPDLMMRHRGLLLFPQGFSLSSYIHVFDNPMIRIGYMNTMFYVILGTLLNIVMTALGAYALSRKGVMWRNPIMFLIVFTMFFQGGLIPSYLLIGNIGLMDTRWALILPAAMSAYNLIIMRTSFQAIPVSLEEAARIDGANDFVILYKVILPLSLPVIAVMLLFYGVGHWNSWFSALVYLRTRELFPLQLLLREILITNDTRAMMTKIAGDKASIGMTIKYATIIVSTLPILFIYPFLQKYFNKGVLIGALKE
ncbi:carbohydrate ABC transporter permease [Paenibacillus sp. PAMC21692]|uniref:carbohydrate ABC transporter permease n=1 Tax=Paenibacillus sp. PAMC21692 TaxID=2762320 RepID=UPI00164E00ED|nr:carbohydrate ABC transporter permease [Paenibacillus sp. PAMC21692]QNK59532.1 carbohydrate ABC transporter permease [Paenibacillus sp. PAMC21692]